MSEYRYIKEFLELASINQKDIIIQEIDVFNGNVCTYVVVKNENMYNIYTAVGSVDEPIQSESIHDVLLPKTLIEKLFKQIKMK